MRPIKAAAVLHPAYVAQACTVKGCAPRTDASFALRSTLASLAKRLRIRISLRPFCQLMLLFLVVCAMEHDTKQSCMINVNIGKYLSGYCANNTYCTFLESAYCTANIILHVFGVDLLCRRHTYIYCTCFEISYDQHSVEKMWGGYYLQANIYLCRTCFGTTCCRRTMSCTQIRSVH